MLPKKDIHYEPRATWLQVESVSTSSGFSGLRDSWHQLHQKSDASIFTTWEWLFPWYQRLANGVVPWILMLRNATELVGLMPLCLSEQRFVVGRVRRITFLGNLYVGGDYLDVVAQEGLGQLAAGTFARELRDRSDQWDVLDLGDLSSDSPTLGIFEKIFDRDFVCRRTHRFFCPFEEFSDGDTFDSLLRRSSRRNNYLRRRKWLERQAGFRIEKSESPTELIKPLAQFFLLHRRRWAKDGGPSGINSAAVESFHRDAIQLLGERGAVRLYSMRVNRQTIASVYALRHGRKFIYYQSGYDLDWGSRSVGLVLVGETFKDAIREGALQYDFLRGTEPYKFDWTHRLRSTSSLRIFRKKSIGAEFDRFERRAAELRRVAKEILPHAWTRRLRRLRQEPVGR